MRAYMRRCCIADKGPNKRSCCVDTMHAVTPASPTATTCTTAYLWAHSHHALESLHVLVHIHTKHLHRAGGGLEQPSDDVQRGGLPSAIVPKQCQNLRAHMVNEAHATQGWVSASHVPLLPSRSSSSCPRHAHPGHGKTTSPYDTPSPAQRCAQPRPQVLGRWQPLALLQQHLPPPLRARTKQASPCCMNTTSSVRCASSEYVPARGFTLGVARRQHLGQRSGNRKNNGCFGDPWSPGNTASRYIARAAAPHVITHAPTPHSSTTAERTQKQGRVEEKPVEGVHRRGHVDVELEEGHVACDVQIGPAVPRPFDDFSLLRIHSATSTCRHVVEPLGEVERRVEAQGPPNSLHLPTTASSHEQRAQHQVRPPSA